MANPGAALFKAVTSGSAASPAVASSPAAVSPGVALFQQATGTAPDQGLAPVVGTAPKAPSRGILGSIGHGLSVAADTTANLADSLGTGIYAIGKSAVAPGTHPSWGNVAHQWEQAITDPASIFSDKTINSDPLAKIVAAQAKATVEPKTPAQWAMSIGTLASLGAGSLARVAYAADALRAADESAVARAASSAPSMFTIRGANGAEYSAAGESTLRGNALKAIVSPLHKPPTALRFLNVPQTVLQAAKAKGDALAHGVEGPSAFTAKTTPVQIHASGSPLVRAGQAAVDTLTQNALDRSVATGKQTLLSKYGNMRIAGANDEGIRIAQNLRSVPVKIAAVAGHGFDKGISKQEGRLALFLRSNNVTGGEMAKVWAANGATKLADRAQSLEDKGALKIDEHGNVNVNADLYPTLAAKVAQAGVAQDIRAGVIGEHGLMSPEGMQNRLNLVGQKVLGDAARPGQGFISLKTSEKGAPQSPIAQARGTVIPNPKRLSLGQRATGAGAVVGKIPGNSFASVARSAHEALRYMNTVDFRSATAKLGSDVKQTNDEVLMRDPSLPTEGTIPQNIDHLLGRKTSTLGEEEHMGLAAAMRARLEEAIPGLKDNFKSNQAAGIGVRAPEGMKWVPRRMIPGEITKSSLPRGPLEKAAGTINSAVTAATVYFKFGHLPTRVFTNATTNIAQGSANPLEIAKTYSAVKALGGLNSQVVRELASLTGTHGYEALPHEGLNIAGRAASFGARSYAKKIDSPFRVNAVLYELRHIGIESPEQIKAAVAQLKDPARSGMDAAKAARLDWAVRRSNRAAIMYDGLSAGEKRYVARYLWFFPWTKGATRFAFHTASEHPVKALAGAETGMLGAQVSQQQLGNRPSYEYGLTALSGGSQPLTGNFSTFTPYSTVGQVAQVVASPSTVVNQLNPVYSGLAKAASDALGGKSTGQTIRDFVGQATAPTPEAQGVAALKHPQGKGLFPTSSQYLFGKSWQSSLARAFVGAGFPRRTNKSRLATDFAHEHAKKRSITIYTP